MIEIDYGTAAKIMYVTLSTSTEFENFIGDHCPVELYHEACKIGTKHNYMIDWIFGLEDGEIPDGIESYMFDLIDAEDMDRLTHLMQLIHKRDWNTAWPLAEAYEKERFPFMFEDQE